MMATTDRTAPAREFVVAMANSNTHTTRALPTKPGTPTLPVRDTDRPAKPS